MMKKIRKEYLILGVVILMLLGILVFRNLNVVHYRLPELKKIDQADFSRIVISGPKDKIELAKLDNSWVILPQKYPADKSSVDIMLEKLGNLTLTALASESKNYQLYQLDKENRLVVEGFAGEKDLRKIMIGKIVSSGGHTFVMLADDPRVYHADGDLRRAFEQSVPELRDKVVLSIADQITEIDLINQEGEITLVRKPVPGDNQGSGEKSGEQSAEKSGEKGAASSQEKKDQFKWYWNGKPVKDDAVNTMLSTARRLTCDQFLDDKSKADYTNADFSATFKTADKKEYSVFFYGKQNDKYIAATTQNPYLFLLSKWKVDDIMKTGKDLLEK